MFSTFYSLNFSFIYILILTLCYQVTLCSYCFPSKNIFMYSRNMERQTWYLTSLLSVTYHFHCHCLLRQLSKAAFQIALHLLCFYLMLCIINSTEVPSFREDKQPVVPRYTHYRFGFEPSLENEVE